MVDHFMIILNIKLIIVALNMDVTDIYNEL